MPTRNYINEDINGLEQIVRDNDSDREVLEDIKDELQYRKKRKRNVALEKYIDDLLQTIDSDSLEVLFPQCWMSEEIFENSLLGHDFSSADCITFVIPRECKIMVFAATRLLSFCNQLAANNVKVELKFPDGFQGQMSYLHRINFFKHLSEGISITPKLTKMENRGHQGKNKKLVEIESIKVETGYNDALPGRLASSIVDNARDFDLELSERAKNKLITAVKTIFSELLDNVCLHSGTTLPAFAVCQIYNPGNENVAHVAVSDSGLGLLETLRPRLANNYPKKPQYQKLPDNKLVLEIFKTGLSSTSAESGCGLVTCALQALKFNASVSVRLKDNLIKLALHGDGIRIDNSFNKKELTPILGTSIAFEFPLDNLRA